VRSSVDAEDSHSWLQMSSEIANCRRTKCRHAVKVAASARRSQSDGYATVEKRQGDG
jgi:hypothetical protein